MNPLSQITQRAYDAISCVRDTFQNPDQPFSTELVEQDMLKSLKRFIACRAKDVAKLARDLRKQGGDSMPLEKETGLCMLKKEASACQSQAACFSFLANLYERIQGIQTQSEADPSHHAECLAAFREYHLHVEGYSRDMRRIVDAVEEFDSLRNEASLQEDLDKLYTKKFDEIPVNTGDSLDSVCTSLKDYIKVYEEGEGDNWNLLYESVANRIGRMDTLVKEIAFANRVASDNVSAEGTASDMNQDALLHIDQLYGDIQSTFTKIRDFNANISLKQNSGTLLQPKWKVVKARQELLQACEQPFKVLEQKLSNFQRTEVKEARGEKLTSILRVMDGLTEKCEHEQCLKTLRNITRILETVAADEAPEASSTQHANADYVLSSVKKFFAKPSGEQQLNISETDRLDLQTDLSQGGGPFQLRLCDMQEDINHQWGRASKTPSSHPIRADESSGDGSSVESFCTCVDEFAYGNRLNESQSPGYNPKRESVDAPASLASNTIAARLLVIWNKVLTWLKNFYHDMKEKMKSCRASIGNFFDNMDPALINALGTHDPRFGCYVWPPN